jgi:hypothetical protein
VLADNRTPRSRRSARAGDRRRRHAGDGRPRAAVRPPRAVGAAQGRLRQEGRPRRGSDRQEAHAVRARPGLRPRAQGRRQGDRDLPGDPRSRRRRAAGDPGPRPALRPGRALVRPARQPRAPGRAGPRGMAGEIGRAQVPHRPAVAAPPRRSGPRDRELPRGAEMEPATPRRWPRSTAWSTSKDRAGAAARVLEPIYEASRRVRQAGRGARGDHRPHRGSAGAGRPAPPHRRDPRAAARPAAAAFAALARALKDDNGNELTLGHLERFAERTGQWPSWRRSTAAEADKSLDVPRQVDLLARLARVYEQELATRRRQGDRHLPPHPRRRVRQQARRCWRSIGCTPPPSAKDLVDVLRREIQLAESDEEVVNLQFRLGQTLEHALDDKKGAIETYREILTANPAHAPTHDGPRGSCSSRGTTRARSRRSSSRCTRPPASSRSCTASTRCSSAS